MKSLRYLNTVLTVIAVLLGLNLWTAWMGQSAAPAFESRAIAAENEGLANAGAQRTQMIDQLKRLVQRVEEQTALLKSGTVKVKVDAAEKK